MIFDTIPWQWQYERTVVKDNSNRVIPMIIWTYWNESEDNLPFVIRKCIGTWRNRNPHHTINIITPYNINNWVCDIDVTKLRFADTPQRLSDFIRLHVLYTYGGFWVDASTIMFESLDRFHDRQTATPSTEVVGYYMDGFTTRIEYPVIESWFIGCVKECTFIKLWRDEFMRINDYVSVLSYIEHMKWCGISMQNIGYFAYYLNIHAAAQSVIQRHDTSGIIRLEKAEDGPFKYLVDVNWHSKQAIDRLIDHSCGNVPFIKLRSNERKFLHEDVEYLNTL